MISTKSTANDSITTTEVDEETGRSSSERRGAGTIKAVADDGDDDDASFGNNSVSHSHTSFTNDNGSQYEKMEQQRRLDRIKKLAADETRAVKRLKKLVWIVLGISMGMVGYAVYHYTSTSEYRSFEETYMANSKLVLSTLGRNLDQILQSMDAFTVSMVSYAQASNQEWPFVVIPDFAVRADKVRTLASGVFINLYPLVTDEQRLEWENFTSIPENHAWVNETIALQESNPNNKWPIVWNYTNINVIHGYDEYYKDEPGLVGTNRTGK